MSIIQSIQSDQKTAFSFEILPPLKGKGMDAIIRTIDTLREFDPKYINITTHRSEMVYRPNSNGLYEYVPQRHRPGTVAAAAAIQNKYNIPVVPHILCGGFTREETEYVLIDLQFLGITNLLLLRGDKGKHEREFTTTGNTHATDLQQQVNDFNKGIFADGSTMPNIGEQFSYGMACYPEKHEEAPNMDSDLYWAKKKVEAGADYLVTQMFFDNQKYFEFVDKCRTAGITVPIIPGIKPITLRNQLTVLPKIFKTDIPEAFAAELRNCTTDEAATQVGVEWCIEQCRELQQHNVESLHFYTLMATQSVRQVAEAIY